MESRFTCSLCHSFAALDYLSVLRHIRSVHSWEPHFNITCGIDGCVRTYRSFRCYKAHIFTKHSHFVSQPVNTTDIEEPTIHDDLSLENSGTYESAATVQDTPIVRPKLYNRAIYAVIKTQRRETVTAGYH